MAMLNGVHVKLKRKKKYIAFSVVTLIVGMASILMSFINTLIK